MEKLWQREKFLPVLRFGQVRKCTKIIARPTFSSMTRATKTGFGPCGNAEIYTHTEVCLRAQKEAAKTQKIPHKIGVYRWFTSKPGGMVSIVTSGVFRYWGGGSRSHRWKSQAGCEAMELTVSSSLTSDTISTLAFLVSARLFGRLDSSLLGLDALPLVFGGTGEGLELCRDRSGDARLSFKGGGKRPRLDGWKSSSVLCGSSGSGTFTSALTW